MTKLTVKELLIFQDQARKELLTIRGDQFLPGMQKGFTEGEARALAFLRASLMTWGKRGILVADWESKIDLEPLLESSSPETE